MMEQLLWMITENLPALVLAIVVLGLVLAQVVVGTVALVWSRAKQHPGFLRAHVVLATATPAVILALLVLGVQVGRLQLLGGITHASPAYKAEIMARGISVTLAQQFFAGAALVLAAVVGLVFTFLVWRQRRRAAGVATSSLLTVAGSSAATAAFGAGLFMRAYAMQSGFSAIACASADSKADFLATAIEEISTLQMPCLVALALLALAAVAVVMSRGAGNSGGRTESPAPAAVAASVLVLVIGAGTFLATRTHAGDLATLRPLLLQRAHQSSSLYLFVPGDLDLPRPKHFGSLQPAPTIQITREAIRFEHQKVLSLSEPPENPAAAQQKLAGLVDKPPILLVDVKAPAVWIDWVAAAILQSGITRMQVAGRTFETLPTEVYGPLTISHFVGRELQLVTCEKPGALVIDENEAAGDFVQRIDELAATQEPIWFHPAQSLPLPGDAPE